VGGGTLRKLQYAAADFFCSEQHMHLPTPLLLRVLPPFVFLSSFILPALETVITVINHKVSSVMSRFSLPSPTLFCFNNKKEYNLELLEYLLRIF
jgi:hypothetical protein